MVSQASPSACLSDAGASQGPGLSQALQSMSLAVFHLPFQVHYPIVYLPHPCSVPKEYDLYGASRHAFDLANGRPEFREWEDMDVRTTYPASPPALGLGLEVAEFLY